jgi:Histidine kinase-, DNA gyrase B-, and HSP90-like ATPase.
MAVAAAVSAEIKTAVARMAGTIEQVGQRNVDHVQLGHELSRRTDKLRELSAALARYGQITLDELPAHLNASALLSDARTELQGLFERRGQTVQIDAPPRADAVIRPSGLRALIYAMLRHASDASPKGGMVSVLLNASDREVVLVVDDAGAAVPSGARDALLWRRIDPASLGRPVGAELLFAGAIASHLNGWMELDDAPEGGNRTRVRLPVL